MKLLREPLFHFFLLGVLIFAWFTVQDDGVPSQSDPSQIVIDAQDIERLKAQFEGARQRPPTDAEMQSLVNSLVEEEILVREALALGLDQGDGVVRMRLAQKMSFLTTSVAQSLQPDDADLIAFMEQTPEAYQTAPRVSFRHVMLRPDEDPAAVAVTLNAGGNPNGIGARSLLPETLNQVVQTAVDGTFGRGVFDQIAVLPQGQWAGPVASGYGTHLVFVEAFTPARMLPFEEVREDVLQNWRRDQAEALTKAQMQAFRANYDIQLPEGVSLPEDAAE